MTEKRFKAKRHCTDGNCWNFVFDKPNHLCVLMLHSWEDCKDVCDLLNELAEENEQLKKVTKDFAENPTQHNLWKLRTVVLKDSDFEWE